MPSMYLDINDLAGGALSEKINIELQKLAANVLDANTEAEAKRSVTIKIAVKPDEKREIGKTEVSVTSSLAPSKGIPMSFVFDYDNDGNAVIGELITKDRHQLAFNNQGGVMDGTGAPVPQGNVVNGSFGQSVYK
ncbi:hypothetical protein ACFOQM_12585 [Paenibacillus sp. GCM10012307]|uniref:Replication terminator protein n=1 Tax=Paenibacillus roseus TaxID=2798579 RepID=A0A934J2K7_9BACL|nr:hypothetical protein [Paenibacillus roseus]MBJ6362129.1 hypothetical protein [Paenibacillus roseus]